MYLNALEFIEEERDAWRPYESLSELTDEQLSRPVDAAHGWSGRQLVGHLLHWQGHALAVLTELAVNETSTRKEALDTDWEDRGGDVVNEEVDAIWAAKPMSEIRETLRTQPGELRGYMTVVPETRWLKNADYRQFLSDELTDHYEEHLADLEAILAAARVTLRELLEEAAAELDDVVAEVAPDGARMWSHGGRPFAILAADGVAAEFALDAAVAAAAARTPDVTASPRGGGWVRFSPTTLDDQAADRASAWLASAHRRPTRG